GLSVQFTLAQPAVVLVWLDGIAHLNSGSSAGIYLKAVSSSDSDRGAGIFVYDNQYWSPIHYRTLFLSPRISRINTNFQPLFVEIREILFIFVRRRSPTEAKCLRIGPKWARSGDLAQRKGKSVQF
ncbi:MAG: hypothetical protein U9R15_09295, partial [Chloroflexota bacterium]|nr:hypothetical protein [Chloroflexota bacterium]